MTAWFGPQFGKKQAKELWVPSTHFKLLELNSKKLKNQNLLIHLSRLTHTYFQSSFIDFMKWKFLRLIQILQWNLPWLALNQTMTEAEHNRPNPKLFGNRPAASAAELFCETIRPIVSQNIVIKTLRIVSFLWLLRWKEAWLKKS